jgi:hypothetical protein
VGLHVHWEKLHDREDALIMGNTEHGRVY